MAFLDHEGGAEFPYSREDVFQAFLEAIPQVAGMKVDSADKMSGRIMAKAGVSLMSWGENIPITLLEVSPGRTRVTVISTPKTGVMFGGAFDLGKNRRNIEHILGTVSTILSRKPPAAPCAPVAGTPTPAARLAKLKDLRDQQLITQEEFEKRKKEILSEI
jgi:hypothetical protein